MRSDNKKDPRWKHYLLTRSETFNNFWQELLSDRERKLLFVLGQGFDPRMCKGLGTILNAGGRGRLDCLMIQYDEGSNSPSRDYADLIDRNRQTLEELLQQPEALKFYPLKMWSSDGMRRIGALKASSVFRQLADLEAYTDVVVDISAMPLGLYFPIITQLLNILDSAYQEKEKENRTPKIPNLHIVVAEDVNLDKRIVNLGLDESALYLPGFSIDEELRSTLSKIWIPVLGEGKNAQLKKINEYVNPREICPVIPSPSVDPRRGDRLLLEYRQFLFDTVEIEPRNIIYASEQNPFEAYRQIYRTIVHYNKVLEPLGGCHTVVSSISSKLLSMGALLASYELKQKGYQVGFAHVESQGYRIEEEPTTQPELFSLLLAGECYEE